MLRKSEIRNIAHGLLGTFISRNNDIDGYWGLGILREMANNTGQTKIEIDLLIDLLDESAHDHRIQACKAHHRKWLAEMIERKGEEIAALSEARICVRFIDSFDEYPDLRRYTRGLPFECAVQLGTGPQNICSAVEIGVCAPHDPNKDLRRGGYD
jgi:hypothetical protein